MPCQLSIRERVTDIMLFSTIFFVLDEAFCDIRLNICFFDFL